MKPDNTTKTACKAPYLGMLLADLSQVAVKYAFCCPAWCWVGADTVWSLLQALFVNRSRGDPLTAASSTLAACSSGSMQWHECVPGLFGGF
jgi:hypothetical protein